MEYTSDVGCRLALLWGHGLCAGLSKILRHAGEWGHTERQHFLQKANPRLDVHKVDAGIRSHSAM